MLYLASPYSHEKSIIREVRYLAAARACAYFFKHGVPVYSAIVHWHNVAIYHKLPLDAASWRASNFAILAQSTKFGMLLLPEWEASEGMRDELAEANRLGLPIENYLPSELGF